MLGGEFKRFKGWVGINDSAGNVPFSETIFSVSGDGKRLWEPAGIGKGGTAFDFDIDVTGVQMLTLKETRMKVGINFNAHAVWQARPVATR